MSEFLLSFIMPTYNSSEYLIQTLDSLIDSIGDHSKTVEILCVDDGSRDNTVEILKSYQAKFSNLKVFQNEHAGVSTARNTALDNVNGEYLSFVDSDDLYEKNFLDDFLKCDKDFDILFTDVEKLEGDLKYIDISKEEKLEVFKNNFSIGHYKIHPGVAGKFFRTALISDNELRFNTSLSFAEDILFNFTALTKAENVHLSSVDFYNVNGSHSLMFYNDKNLEGQIVFVNKVRELLTLYPESSNKELLENMIILKAMTVYIDRYFGPLWLNKTYSLKKASQLLKETIETNDFHKAFRSNALDYAIGNRYIIFRKLLKCRQYKLCLLYNRVMDKLKGYERFRS
ncbi:glycosyltransferase family 2 protein [Streptococcus sp. 10F2]